MKPRLSFALFAYNHEDYIREALEAALAQTYENLEIVASDDCSKDGTYEIMEEVVSNYSGPHKVILNRNPVNLGIAGHLNKIFELSSGEILVSAAGDDVSLPDRVKVIADVFSNSHEDTMVVYSDGWITDENGKRLREIGERVSARYPYSLDELIRKPQYLVGATMAWRRELVAKFGAMVPSTMNEDVALLYRAFISGRVKYTDEKLVDWRRIEGSLSEQVDDVLRSRLRSYKWYMAIFQQILTDLDSCKHPDESLSKLAALQVSRNTYLHGVWENPGSFFSTVITALKLRCPAVISEYFRSKRIER